MYIVKSTIKDDEKDDTESKLQVQEIDLMYKPNKDDIIAIDVAHKYATMNERARPFRGFGHSYRTPQFMTPKRKVKKKRSKNRW